MIPVVAAAAMRALDARATAVHGIPGLELMEQAGHALADAAARGRAKGARIALLCGAGNNGGDGHVAARRLVEAGHDARIVLAVGEPRTPDAIAALASARAAGVAVIDASTPETLAAVAPWIRDAHVVLDALLGTGLARAPEGAMRAAIELVATVRGRVISADVPSGVDADTGRTPGVCVRAAATVTFAAPKPGIVTGAGAVLAGVLELARIGVPEAEVRAAASAWILEDADVRAVVPRRAPDAHKGTSGHVLIVGGAPGRAGAALLAGLGALRGGAGLVTLAVPSTIATRIEGRVPELMVEPFELDAGRGDAHARLATLAEGKRAIVWGPGATRGPAADALLVRALATLAVPIVLDAEAFAGLAGLAAGASLGPGPRVLTPHPGEAARLLGIATADVQADRLGAARALVARFGQPVILKGHRTVVASPGEAPVIIAAGDPVLGAGGTGDVLAGVVGALLAQGLAPVDAARAAAHLHGRAGERLGRRQDRGVLAREVARAVPRVLATLLA